MFKKCVLSFLILVPSHSNAISDQTAKFMTGTVTLAGGALGSAIGKDCSKSDRALLTVGFGLISGLFSYLFFYDLTPGARLKQAKRILNQVGANLLVNTPENDLNNYADDVTYLLVRNDFPLLEAFKQLSKCEDQTVYAIDLLELALGDADDNSYLYNNILEQREKAACLELKVRNRLYSLKADGRYHVQSELAYQRQLQADQMSLLQQKVDAEKAKADAARANAAAQQAKADAALINSAVNVANSLNNRR